MRPAVRIARALIPRSWWSVLLWLARPDVRAVCGFRDYVRVQHFSGKRGRHARAAPFIVTAESLSGLPVILRPGTSDAPVFVETLVGRFHEPPPGLNPKRIWDIGANLGLTTAHYAVLFPEATITAVEPQPYLATVARVHTYPWQARCNVVQGAVWTEDGRLTFSVTPGEEYGGRIGTHEGGDSLLVPSFCLDTLMKDDAVVDFVKLDIEGAEAQVLKQNTAWAAKVRCIQVECHGAYSVEACVEDLTRLGFQAARNERHWASVVGVKAAQAGAASA